MLKLFYLFIISIPFKDVSYNIQEFEVLRPDWIIGAIFVLSFVFKTLLNKKSIRFNKVTYFILIFNFIPILTLVKTLTVSDFSDWLTIYLQLIFVSLLFLAIYNLEIKPKELYRAFRIWFFTGSFVSLYAIYKNITLHFNLNLPLIRGAFQAENTDSNLFLRLESVFSEPSFLGAYLGPLVVMFAVIIFYRKDQKVLFRKRYLNLFFLFICFFALILTLSMSAYFSLIMVLAFLLLFIRESRPILLKKTVIVAIIFVLLLFITPMESELDTLVLQRFMRIHSLFTLENTSSLHYSSIGRRAASLIAGFRAWLSSPILGIGTNNLEKVSGKYLPSWVIQIPTASVHNSWGQVLVDFGLLGFVPFVGIWFLSLRKLFNGFRRYVKTDLGIVLLLAVFTLLLSDVFRMTMGYPYVSPMLWFHLGFASLTYKLIMQS